MKENILVSIEQSVLRELIEKAESGNMSVSTLIESVMEKFRKFQGSIKFEKYGTRPPNQSLDDYLKEIERDEIEKALNSTETKNEAASELGISFEMIVILADLIITIIFIIKILGVIKKQEEVVPIKIRYYLLLILIFSFVFLAAEIPLAYWANGGELLKEDFESFKGSVQTIIFCLIWRSYFSKSRRVELYYKKATSRSEL